MNSVQKKLNLKFFMYGICYFAAFTTKTSERPICRYYEKEQNAHGERNVLPKMFVGGCWHFLEKCWKSGWSEQDVRDRRPATWMSPRAVPVRIRTATHFSLENSHPETLHRGRMFRSPWAFVEVNIKKIYVNIPVFTASTSYFLSRAVFH